MTVAVGMTARHLAIRDWLVRFGLRPGMDVYELGCGSGGVTELIAEVLEGQGSILAVDVNLDVVIDAAERLSGQGNITVRCEDAVDFDAGTDRFDVIVLPDVLEHIAAVRHKLLFTRLAMSLRRDGVIFIHIPNPPFLAWIHRHRPDLLQKPIDKPVPTRSLLASAEAAGLHLHHLETYTVWQRNHDYQAIVLRHLAAASEFELDA